MKAATPRDLQRKLWNEVLCRWLTVVLQLAIEEVGSTGTYLFTFLLGVAVQRSMKNSIVKWWVGSLSRPWSFVR